MSDTKLLQSILDGQRQIREDIKALDKKVDNVNENLSGRIDKLGESLAYLEDDTPTRKEHRNLEKRVTKLERKLAAN